MAALRNDEGLVTEILNFIGIDDPSNVVNEDGVKACVKLVCYLYMGKRNIHKNNKYGEKLVCSQRSSL